MRSLVLAALCVLTPAHAVETFMLNIGGTVLRAPVTDPDHPLTLPWLGTIVIKTTSKDDGVYTGPSLLWLDVQSTWIGFGTTGALVTLAGGEIVDLEYSHENLTLGKFYNAWGLHDMTIYVDLLGGGIHTTGVAPLSHAPEPETYALILAGLLLMGANRFRNRLPS